VANSADRLDAVPVATVIRSSDVAIALPHAEQDEGFVLGRATLDLKDPVVRSSRSAWQTPRTHSCGWDGHRYRV